MKDDQLTIHSIGFASEQKQASNDVVGAVDPFANKPASPAASINPSALMNGIAAQVLADARVGTYVQIDGEIKRSNAKLRKGNLITLAEANIGELMSDPIGTRLITPIDKQYSVVRRSEAAEMVAATAGLDADLQRAVTVQLQ